MTNVMPVGPSANADAPLTVSMPALFHAADSAAISAQRQFMILSAIMLLGLALAAVGGAFTWTPTNGNTDICGLLAVFGFVLALAMKVQILTSRVDRAWYEGRAAAESVKTLAWRYAVGGAPFLKETDDGAGADELFSIRLREVLTDLSHVSLSSHPTATSVQITGEMRAVRSLTLTHRQETYRQQRILDQEQWYANKAEHHEHRARFWSLSMLSFELLGAGGALLKTIGAVNVDLLGIAAAATAGIIAWEQLRHDGSIARAYAIAAQELGAIDVLLPHQRSEADWAEFVGSGEEAISREHTLWRASRAQVK